MPPSSLKHVGFLPVHTASHSISPNFYFPTSYYQFIFFNSFLNFKISYSKPLNLSESCYASSSFCFPLSLDPWFTACVVP